jgi:hypothetical protein
MPLRRFVLIVLPLFTASVGAAACTSGVSGTGTSATTGGTGATGGAGGASTACPASTPSSGAACAGVQSGTACMYPTPCCEDTVATCKGGQWDVQEGACLGVLPKPPPPSCPPEQPAAGSSCAGDCLGPTTCQYGTCPGSMQPAVFATCEGTWVISLQCDAGAGGGAGGGG